MRHLRIGDFHLRHRLYDALVESVAAYGCEIWAPELLVSDTGHEHTLEAQRRDALRYMLEVLKYCPNLVLYAETGCYPRAVRWLVAVAKAWNRLVKMPEERLTEVAFRAQLALAGEHGWARQVIAALKAVGLEPLAGGAPAAVSVPSAKRGAQQRVIDALRAAAAAHGPSSIQAEYLEMRGELTPRNYAAAAHLDNVRSAGARVSLTRVRTGSSWLTVPGHGSTEVEEGEVVEHECPHCGSGSRLSTAHVLLDCAAFRGVRGNFPRIFSDPPASLEALMGRGSVGLAQ